MQNIHAIDYKYKLKLYETGFCVVSKKKRLCMVSSRPEVDTLTLSAHSFFMKTSLCMEKSCRHAFCACTSFIHAAPDDVKQT